MKVKGELYRDTDKGQIAGVCAGVAEYFGWELWLVRIIMVSGFLLTGGSFFLMAYVLGWFILEKKPKGLKNSNFIDGSGQRVSSGNVNVETKIEVKSKVWQAGEPPIQAFVDIESSFGKLETRLRRMESYVTSSEFQLNREFKNL